MQAQQHPGDQRQGRDPACRGPLRVDAVERLRLDRRVGPPTAPDPSKIVADAARKDALKCFGDELKKDPKAGGTVTLKVGVAANGKVVKTEVVKSTSSKPLTDCVVDVVGKLSSLDFKQPTTLEVPFVFRD